MAVNMDNVPQWLIVFGTVPLLLLFSPLIILVAPLLVAGWTALVLVQIFAPRRLPAFLVEFQPLTACAAAATSTIRVMREKLFSSATASGDVDEPEESHHVNAKPVPHKERYELGDVPLLEAAGQYGELVRAVRQLVREDSVAAFAHPAVKRWLGKRWRNLFLQYAAAEPAAVSVASQHGVLVEDPRPVAQRLAERFLKLPLPSSGVHEWQQVGSALSLIHI